MTRCSGWGDHQGSESNWIRSKKITDQAFWASSEIRSIKPCKSWWQIRINQTSLQTWEKRSDQIRSHSQSRPWDQIRSTGMFQQLVPDLSKVLGSVRSQESWRYWVELFQGTGPASGPPEQLGNLITTKTVQSWTLTTRGTLLHHPEGKKCSMLNSFYLKVCI